MTVQQQNKVAEIVNKIVDEYEPEKIILFGSHAWGNPDNESDVDLLVVKNTSQKRVVRETELYLKLAHENFPPMDLIVLTPKEVQQEKEVCDFFFEEIFTNGAVMYEAKTSR